MTTRTFRFYSDPGHGWVRVEKAFLLQIIGDNWRDTFTQFSYERGDYVYLEEDADAARFTHWCRASGIEPVFKSASPGIANRYSRIRNYLPLSPA
jgi:hypothetical protein